MPSRHFQALNSQFSALTLLWRLPLLTLCVLLLGSPVIAEEPSAASKVVPGVNSGATYVGAEVCKGCHQAEFKAWQGSHHDWAMKEASKESVLGDFNNRSFEHHGVKSRFYQQGKDFFVKTENAEGKLQAFKVDYTFGFYPLQQYLVDTGRGHLQALSIAWDSRPKNEGGQRWFHLQADENIPAGDMLHWTGPYYNWNSRCAECHSTNLKRNYNVATDSYRTSWSEINVACESCHGAGSEHVRVAKSAQKNMAKSFIQSLNPVGRWLHKTGQATATRDIGTRKPGEINPQMAVCASCHSRRTVLANPAEHQPGQDFLDTHRLNLIEAPSYHADGQILDEVYVYGSFMQSKMFHQGVQCSNCHEPHSLKLRAPGNGVCSQCHQPSKYDQPEHHRHLLASAGAQCVNCHMPETTYMVVDPRRDHSIRIPRPDLSLQHKTPNACNQCHTDKSTSWAAKHFGVLYPSPTSSPALLGARPLQAAQNTQLSAIARASLLAGFSEAPSQPRLGVLQSQLQSPEPIIRLGAVAGLQSYPANIRWSLLQPLLADPVKAVRLDAIRLLLDVPAHLRKGQNHQAWNAQLAEYKATLDFHSDTAPGQLNLGLYHLAAGDLVAAGQAYQRAIKKEPFSPAAYLNLADLKRQQGDETAALGVLRQAQSESPQTAEVYHALGLALVRAKQYPEALINLETAHQLRPANTRFVFVYGVALNSTGQRQKAVEVLAAWLQSQPMDVNIASFLRQLYLQQGEVEKAEALRRLMPQKN